MKKHFFRIFLAVLCIVAGIMLSHLKLEDVYDLSIERTTISDVNLEYDRGVYRASTLTPKNIWYIGLKKEIFPDTSHDQIELCAVWYTHSGALRECVDHDGKDASGEYYTFPVGTDLLKYIAFSLESSTPIRPEDITLYSINTLSQGKRIAWDIIGTRAENGVISRAQWGADESLRYWDSAKQKAKYQAFLAYAVRPKTQKELDTIKRNQEIDAMIAREGGDTTQLMSMERFENGRPLVWPIQRVKQVNRIVVHHTADSLDKYADDMAMIRAIYAYHAVSR